MIVLLLALGALAASAADETPAPVVRATVSLRFPGAVTSTWSDLADLAEMDIRNFARSGFDQAYADDAADRLERAYRSRGHPAAVVEYDEAASEPQEGRLVFRVREGPRLMIGDVVIRGAETMDAEVLARFVRRRSGLFSAPILVESRIDADLRSIESYYAEHGFLGARATAVWPTGGADGETVDVTVTATIVEGVRTFIRRRDVRFVGPDKVPEDDLRAVVKAVLREQDPVEGRAPFDRMVPYRLRNALLDLYGSRGFPFARAEVRVEISEDRTRASLSVEIVEGERAKVSFIDVEGNLEVPSYIIWREFEARREKGESPPIGIGDRYDVQRVRNTQLALLKTGHFTSVRIEPVPVPGEPRRVALRVRVSERDPRTLDARVGWGSYEMLRLGVTYENKAWSVPGELLGLDWNGHALGLRLQAEASARGAHLSGRLRDPRILGTRVAGVLGTALDQRENVSFSYRRASAYLGFSRNLYELDPKLGVEVVASYSVTDTYRVVGEIDPEFQNVVNVSSVSVGLVGDWRDARMWPTTGTDFAIRAELATRVLGGDIDFVRITAQASRHWPLRRDGQVTLSIGGRFGIIAPLGSTKEIPLAERFLSGGSTSVRSYEEQELGPHLNGDPLGGEAFTTWNAELRFPIHRPVYGAVFVDAGNLFQDAGDLGFDDMKFGLGAGLRIRTPVGPLSLDAAWNPDPGDRDPDWAWHVSVGFAF